MAPIDRPTDPANDTFTMSAEGEPIVVTGYRNPDTGEIGFSWGGYSDPETGLEPNPTLSPDSGGSPLADEDAVQVSIKLDYLTEEEKKVVEDLIRSYYTWVDYLASLPPSTIFYLPDGQTATATELLGMFRLSDFEVYPNEFPHGNGGAGFADYNGGNPILGINIDQLSKNMSTDDQTAWYFTHELAHMTAAGRAFNNAMDDSTSPGGLETTQSEWDSNEQYANSLGDAIARASGYTFSAIWQASGAPGGYYGTVTWSISQ